MANIMPIRPPEDLRNLIKEVAKAKGMTVNGLILQILWDWLKENKAG